MRSNCPTKYCVEHAKHASKVYLETDKRNHRIIKLKNNSLFNRESLPFDGKGSEGLKLAIVSIVKVPQKTTAQCVSVADSRSPVECWEGAKMTGINTKQAKKTINVSWATVHVQLMTRTSNGAYYWRVHAQLEARLYT